MRELIEGLLRGELVPRYVDGVTPVTAHERDVVSRMDGLRTVDELVTPLMNAAAICNLVLELVWFQSVVLDEVVLARESEPEERPVSGVMTTADANEESPLALAVMEYCASSRNAA